MCISKPMLIYDNTYLLFDEYLVNIDRNAITSGYQTKLSKIYYIIIKDLNTFSDRKTNIGLFNLSTHLILTFYLNGLESSINRMIPRNAKLTFNRL